MLIPRLILGLFSGSSFGFSAVYAFKGEIGLGLGYLAIATMLGLCWAVLCLEYFRRKEKKGG